jgi:hypothetical protein
MQLSGDLKDMMTTGPLCWQRFKRTMGNKWRMDLKQIRADERSKKQGESYAAFGVDEHALLRKAYPEASSESVIARIRARLDVACQMWCRERTDVDRFILEMVEYDQMLQTQKILAPMEAARSKGRSTLKEKREFRWDG